MRRTFQWKDVKGEKKAKFLFTFRTLKGLSAIQSRAPFIQKYLVHEYKQILP